jgi:hypothetical protein
MLAALALIALLQATEPAPAPVASPTSAATEVPQKAESRFDPQRIECCRTRPPTGSRLGRERKICRSAKEWEQAEENARKAMRASDMFRGNPEGGN